MTQPEFWLTVLSSVIGAAIGAAIAYWFGNRQIKKQIEHSIDIYDASIQHSNVNETKRRLTQIYSHEIVDIQHMIIQAKSESESNLEQFKTSSNVSWYIRPVQIFSEVYLLSTGLQSAVTKEINEDRLEELTNKIYNDYCNLRLPEDDEDYSETFEYLLSKVNNFINDVAEFMKILNHEMLILENIQQRDRYIESYIEKQNKIRPKTH